MGKLLDVVAYMHLQGVTHRDLKLENLVLKDPKGLDLSSVTLIDFGLAKAARARERMQVSESVEYWLSILEDGSFDVFFVVCFISRVSCSPYRNHLITSLLSSLFTSTFIVCQVSPCPLNPVLSGFLRHFVVLCA